MDVDYYGGLGLHPSMFTPVTREDLKTRFLSFFQTPQDPSIVNRDIAEFVLDIWLEFVTDFSGIPSRGEKYKGLRQWVEHAGVYLVHDYTDRGAKYYLTAMLATAYAVDSEFLEHFETMGEHWIEWKLVRDADMMDMQSQGEFLIKLYDVILLAYHHPRNDPRGFDRDIHEHYPELNTDKDLETEIGSEPKTNLKNILKPIVYHFRSK